MSTNTEAKPFKDKDGIVYNNEGNWIAFCGEDKQGCSWAKLIAATFNSYDAAQAKIKALTGALENLLDDPLIKDAAWMVEHKPGDEVDDEDARSAACLESARAALALPSA